MTLVNIHEAKTQLSRWLVRAAAGEDIVIAKAGKPMVRLVPFEKQKRRRKPGLDRDRLVIARDFDAPLPDEILREFEG